MKQSDLNEILKRPAIAARNSAISEARHARLLASLSAKPEAPLVKDSQGELKGQGSGQVRYRVDWVLYSCQPLDWDNAAASVKPAQDALVELGWIPSDDWKTLEGTAISKKVKTKAEQRTEITITQLMRLPHIIKTDIRVRKLIRRGK